MNDFYVIAQSEGISSPVKGVNIFTGDFIAHVIGISDLSEEKQKGQLQIRPLPCRASYKRSLMVDMIG